MNKPTHPLKEVEILINAAAYELECIERREGGSLEDAQSHVNNALETLQRYILALKFDEVGNPSSILTHAERELATEEG